MSVTLAKPKDSIKTVEASTTDLKSLTTTPSTVPAPEMLEAPVAPYWSKPNKTCTRSSNHEWSTDSFGSSRCPVCLSIDGLDEVHNYVKSLGVDVAVDVSGLVPHYRVPLYVKKSKIAIEFASVYFFTEFAGKYRNYQKAKWEAFKQAGIRLITVWSDDWVYRPETVKVMLADALNARKTRTVKSRNCTISFIETNAARTFFDSRHMRGTVKADFYVGLRHSATLVAVMALTQTKTGSLVITRYAESCHVENGFQTLLDYFLADYKCDYTEVVAYTDNSFDTGLVLSMNNFVKDAVMRPKPYFVIQGRRIPASRFDIETFKANPYMLFDSKDSFVTHAYRNKVEVLWDAGQTRWVYDEDYSHEILDEN